jgi:phosphate transport system substrate-binding protein
MGTFSTDVSKQANAGDATSASSTELIVAGSTTVQPASENLAKSYMTAHPGVKINVQGGGSGAGVSSVGMGIVDIGASSELSKITDAIATGKDEYVDLKYTQIGGSAVVIVSKAVAAGVTLAELDAAYAEATAGTATTAAHGSLAIGSQMFQRLESSGTEEAVAKALPTYASAKNLDASNAKPVQGNQGMLDAIKDSTAGVGFLDWGYASTSGLNFVEVEPATCAPASSTSIKLALKALSTSDTPTQTATMYNVKLARGLYYVTKGEPTPIQQSFITFAASPDGALDIQKAGMFGISDFAI